MVERISKYLCGVLVERRIISKEDTEVYEYGLKALVMLSLGTTTVLFLGILFDSILTTIIFLISFISLRAFYPGVHLKSKLSCFICSVLIYVICLSFTRVCMNKISLSIICYSIIFLSICLNIIQYVFIDKSVEWIRRFKHGLVVHLLNLIIFFVFVLEELNTYYYIIYAVVVMILILKIFNFKGRTPNLRDSK